MQDSAHKASNVRLKPQSGIWRRTDTSTSTASSIFRGCPQGPTGQAVFEAVQAVELHGHGLVSLARALAYEVYPDCDYEPLSSWIASVFDQLHARAEVGPATSFARGLGPRMDRRLQEALFRAAEDTEFAGEGPRRIFADAALRHRPLERRIAEAIEAFGREIPRQVKVAVTYRLGREQGAVFFAALAEAAPSLSTEHMVPVAAAIRRDILDGRVDPGEPGLAQLRDHLESRRGFPKGAQIPGEPQSPAPEWWLTRTGSTLAMGLWCHLESRTSVAVVCSFPVRTTTGSGCGTRYWSSSIDPWRGIPDPWDAPRHRSRALRRCAGWLRDL